MKIIFWILLFYKSIILITTNDVQLENSNKTYFIHINDVIKYNSGDCKIYLCKKAHKSIGDCTFQVTVNSDDSIPRLNDTKLLEYLACSNLDPIRVLDKIQPPSVKILSNISDNEMKVLLPGFKIICKAYNVALLWIEILEHCNDQSTLAIGKVTKITNFNVTFVAEYVFQRCKPGNFPKITGVCRTRTHNGEQLDDKNFTYFIPDTFISSTPTYVEYGKSFSCVNYYNGIDGILEDPGLATVLMYNSSFTLTKMSWKPIKLNLEKVKYKGTCNKHLHNELKPLIVYFSYKVHYSFTFDDYTVINSELIKCHGCFLTSDNENNAKLSIAGTENCLTSRPGWTALLSKGFLKDSDENWKEQVIVDKSSKEVTCKIDNIIETKKIKTSKLCSDISPPILLTPNKPFYLIHDTIYCHQKMSKCSNESKLDFKFYCKSCNNTKINSKLYFNKISIPSSLLMKTDVKIDCKWKSKNISAEINIASAPFNMSLERFFNKTLKPYDLILCNALAYPYPKFEWFFNSKKVDWNSELLIIPEDVYHGNINVTCKATNIFGMSWIRKQFYINNELTEYKKVYDYKCLSIIFYGGVYLTSLFVFLSMIFHEMIYNAEVVENKQLKRMLNQSTSDESTASNRPFSMSKEQKHASRMNSNINSNPITVDLKNSKLYEGDIIVRYNFDNKSNDNCDHLLSNSFIVRSDNIFESTSYDINSESNTNNKYREKIINEILDICNSQKKFKT